MDLWRKQIAVRHFRFKAMSIVVTVGLLMVTLACTHPVRRLIFQSHKIPHVPDFPDDVSGLERIWLQTGQDRVEGWLFKGRGVSVKHPGPAVMIAHGNRELIDFYLDWAGAYQALGFTVLMGEYRGYGRSGGRPTREGIRSDFIEFYDKLASYPGVDPQRIVLHGRSLGGAVLADLAARRRPAAVILESTFTSIKAMAHGAPDFLLTDNYDTISAMAGFEGSVLIIHGTRDRVVPAAHAKKLKQAIAHASVYMDDFGHNDDPPNWSEYWAHIKRFLKNAGILKGLTD